MTRPALLLVLLLPVACAQPQGSDTAEVLQEVLASHQASIAGIEGRPAPTAPAAATAAAASPARPSRGVPASLTMAGQLVGQTPEELLQLLGEPRLRRPEGPAEIWHYQAAQCHLDLVLYREEGPRAPLRVAHAAARAVGTARRGEAACLRDIARGATAPSRPGGFATAMGA